MMAADVLPIYVTCDYWYKSSNCFLFIEIFMIKFHSDTSKLIGQRGLWPD